MTHAGMALQEAYELGMVILGFGALILFSYIAWSLSPKVLGFIMLLFGVFVLRYYPRMSPYQPIQFQRGGLIIGLFLVVIGIILIIFA